MRSRALLLALTLLAAGLAGCADGSGDPATESPDADGDVETANTTPENETTSEEAAPADEGPRVQWFNGSVQGQHVPAVGSVCLLACDNQFTFDVPDNTTALLGEIAWETDATMRFDLDIPYDKCEAGMGEDCPPETDSGSEGYLRIQTTDIATGEWHASAWAQDSPTQPVDITIAISQFDEDRVPPDYARLGDT